MNNTPEGRIKKPCLGPRFLGGPDPETVPSDENGRFRTSSSRNDRFHKPFQMNHPSKGMARKLCSGLFGVGPPESKLSLKTQHNLLLLPQTMKGHGATCSTDIWAAGRVLEELCTVYELRHREASKALAPLRRVLKAMQHEQPSERPDALAVVTTVPAPLCFSISCWFHCAFVSFMARLCVWSVWCGPRCNPLLRNVSPYNG